MVSHPCVQHNSSTTPFTIGLIAKEEPGSPREAREPGPSSAQRTYEYRRRNKARALPTPTSVTTASATGSHCLGD